jgi:siroheme synthase-like protein
MKMLVVGAGAVGYEKLFFILKSSPEANITVVATWVSDELTTLLEQKNFNVNVIIKPFESSDIDGYDLVVAATNDRTLNEQIQKHAKAKEKLINVADTPDLCDFYLGSIVTRGPLKVAISTNGQSPTFAKRFRQMLEAILPEEVEDLIANLKTIRDRLEGDFDEKVKQLNDVTASLVEKE